MATSGMKSVVREGGHSSVFDFVREIMLQEFLQALLEKQEAACLAKGIVQNF